MTRPFLNCRELTKPQGSVFNTEQLYSATPKEHKTYPTDKKLRGSPFYYMSEQVFCEEDFLRSRVKSSVEVCDSCGFLITDMVGPALRVVQAVGKSFHPACFHCVVCNKSLEGELFSVDSQSKIYCVKDFQRSIAPTCEACGLLILPSEGSAETVQVVSMERNYHLECYHCNFGESVINSP
ncbi:hypothetical protein NFI96_014344 [Prochilodus magdalenae]|nr:hypothetical protein NFI96_014344 [Prochilodus magdalenae]